VQKTTNSTIAVIDLGAAAFYLQAVYINAGLKVKTIVDYRIMHPFVYLSNTSESFCAVPSCVPRINMNI